jgi:predicted enzyme related to lactoylglutathione lyase
MLAVLVILKRRAAMIPWRDAPLVSTALHGLCGFRTRATNTDLRRGKMAFKLNHVHLKTQDPQQTAKFDVENLGATMVSEIGTRGYRLDLHGLTLNVTTFVDDQTRQQVYGMEHFALNTDDLNGVVAKLKANGARVLEQMASGNGRRICFLDGPDGVQLEIIEMQG